MTLVIIQNCALSYTARRSKACADWLALRKTLVTRNNRWTQYYIYLSKYTKYVVSS